MIQNIVKNEIFPMIGQGKLVEAEKSLKRLAMMLTGKKSTEDFRIVLCSLARIRFIQGDIKNAKHYMIRFKDKLTKDKNYANEYKDGYCNYLNLYAEIYADKLTKEEKIEINKTNYDNAEINKDLTIMLTARSNIALLEEDLEEIEDLLMEIHMYENSKILNIDEIDDFAAWVMTEEILEGVRNIKDEIIKELKQKFPNYMNENYNCAY